MSKQLHVIMGLPSSGKTTYAEESENIPHDATLIELAQYATQGDVGPRMSDQDWGRVYSDIQDCAQANEHVVIDGNNTHSTSRRLIIDLAQQAGYEDRSLHIMCTTPKKCIKRIDPSRDEYPQVRKMITHQTELFFQSLADIPNEWWDSVFFVGQGETEGA